VRGGVVAAAWHDRPLVDAISNWRKIKRPCRLLLQQSGRETEQRKTAEEDDPPDYEITGITSDRIQMVIW
jgi:hypothetical protein